VGRIRVETEDLADIVNRKVVTVAQDQNQLRLRGNSARPGRVPPRPIYQPDQNGEQPVPDRIEFTQFDVIGYSLAECLGGESQRIFQPALSFGMQIECEAKDIGRKPSDQHIQ
jgi:hypothetical protein